MSIILSVCDCRNEKNIERFSQLFEGMNRVYLDGECIGIAEWVDTDDDEILKCFWQTPWENPEDAILLLRRDGTSRYTVYRAPTTVDRTFENWRELQESRGANT